MHLGAHIDPVRAGLSILENSSKISFPDASGNDKL